MVAGFAPFSVILMPRWSLKSAGGVCHLSRLAILLLAKVISMADLPRECTKVWDLSLSVVRQSMSSS